MYLLCKILRFLIGENSVQDSQIVFCVQPCIQRKQATTHKHVIFTVKSLWRDYNDVIL